MLVEMRIGFKHVYMIESAEKCLLSNIEFFSVGAKNHCKIMSLGAWLRLQP